MNTQRLPEDLARLVDVSHIRRPEGLTVACYTFPHYHRSAINDRIYGDGWTEYVLMRGTRPRFPGHHQPRTPLLGELDEREPRTWERYVDLAVQSGVNTLIWDWYWYDGEPALHEALEEGYLQAAGHERIQFAVMWVNHPWYYWFPTRGEPAVGDPQGMFGTGGLGARELVYPAPESPQDIWRSLTYIVARYFHRANYWRIDDEPVLVMWDMSRLLRDLGEEGARVLLRDLRQLARTLGHKGIHLHTPHHLDGPLAGAVERIGFDSHGSYNAVADAAQLAPGTVELPGYGTAAADTVTAIWPARDKASTLPYFPSVSPGWDNSARCFERVRGDQPDRERWPGNLIVTDESPAAFEALTRAALAFLGERPDTPPVMTIGCWNEWTEGQYLLPDTRHGYGMLRALARGLRDGPIDEDTTPADRDLGEAPR